MDQINEDTIKYILKTLKKLDERVKALEDDKRPLKLPDLTTKKMEYQMERMMAEGEKIISHTMTDPIINEEETTSDEDEDDEPFMVKDGIEYRTTIVYL